MPLPTYTQQVDLGLRQQLDARATPQDFGDGGQLASQAGQLATSVGEQMAQTGQKREEQWANAAATKAQLDWTQKMTAQKAAIEADPSQGSGFISQTKQNYDQYMDQALQNAPTGRARDLLQSHLNNLGVGIMGQAAETQARANVDWSRNTLTQSLQNTLQAMPAMGHPDMAVGKDGNLTSQYEGWRQMGERSLAAATGVVPTSELMAQRQAFNHQIDQQEMITASNQLGYGTAANLVKSGQLGRSFTPEERNQAMNSLWQQGQTKVDTSYRQAKEDTNLLLTQAELGQDVSKQQPVVLAQLAQAAKDKETFDGQRDNLAQNDIGWRAPAEVADASSNFNAASQISALMGSGGLFGKAAKKTSEEDVKSFGDKLEQGQGDPSQIDAMSKQFGAGVLASINPAEGSKTKLWAVESSVESAKTALQTAQAVGLNNKQMQDMNPQQVSAFMDNLKQTKGEDSSEYLRTKMYADERAKAVTPGKAEYDPTSYNLQSSDIKAAFDKMQQDQQNAKDPQSIQQSQKSTKDFMDMNAARQTALGIPPENQMLLPKQLVTSMADNLNTQLRAGPSQAIQSIQSIKQLYGDRAGQVFNMMTKDVSEDRSLGMPLQILAALPDGSPQQIDYAQSLGNVSKGADGKPIPPKSISPKENEAMANAMGTDPLLKSFNTALGDRTATTNQYNQMHDATMNLAQDLLSHGKASTPEAAVQQASSITIGANFGTVKSGDQTFLVPRGTGTDAPRRTDDNIASVGQGLEVLKKDVFKNPGAIDLSQAAANYSYSDPATQKQLALRAVMDKAQWSKPDTVQDRNGKTVNFGPQQVALMAVGQNGRPGPVYDVNGQPILADFGTAQARQEAMQARINSGGHDPNYVAPPVYGRRGR